MSQEELLEIAKNYVRKEDYEKKLKEFENKLDTGLALIKTYDTNLSFLRAVLRDALKKQERMVVKDLLSPKEEVLIVDIKEEDKKEKS